MKGSECKQETGVLSGENSDEQHLVVLLIVDKEKNGGF